jgi:pilus assembly protein Flp/PilA
MNTVKKFLSNESGATFIEYALLAAIVGIGLVAALGALQTKVSGTFSNVSKSL